MNPRVSPSTKTSALLPGKNGLCANLNGGISSHIKAETTNYDLSNLDVVPLNVKAASPKANHVHFLPDRQLDLPLASPGKARKSSPTSQTGVKSCSDGGGVVSASNRINGNDNKSTPASHKLQAVTRSQSLNCQTSSPHPPMQRSQSINKDDPPRSHPADLALNVPSDGGKSPSSMKSRSLASYISTATTTTITTSTTATSPCLVVNHKPPSGTRKETTSGLSVHFADPVLSSPVKRDRHESPGRPPEGVKKDKAFYSETLTKIYIDATRYPPCSEHDTRPVNSTDPSSTPSNNLKNGSGSLLGSSEDFRYKRYKEPTSGYSPDLRHYTHAQHTPNGPSQSPNLAYSKTPPRYYDKPINDFKNYPTSFLSSFSSTSLKLLDQLKFESLHNGSQSLTPSSSLSSSSSLGKEAPPSSLYDFGAGSPSAYPKSSRHHVLNIDDFPLSPLPSGSSSSSSSTATPSKTGRRSSACLRSDCVLGNRLDYISTSGLSPSENHTPSASSTPSSSSNLDLNSYLEPYSPPSKKYEPPHLSSSRNLEASLAALIKKESIAASYQLEYCWFCGRPMPPLGTRWVTSRFGQRLLFS